MAAGYVRLNTCPCGVLNYFVIRPTSCLYELKKQYHKFIRLSDTSVDMNTYPCGVLNYFVIRPTSCIYELKKQYHKFLRLSDTSVGHEHIPDPCLLLYDSLKTLPGEKKCFTTDSQKCLFRDADLHKGIP